MLIELTPYGTVEANDLVFLADAEHRMADLAWQTVDKSHAYAEVPGGWLAVTRNGHAHVPDPDHRCPPEPG